MFIACDIPYNFCSKNQYHDLAPSLITDSDECLPVGYDGTAVRKRYIMSAESTVSLLLLNCLSDITK